jgi:serine/threonine protein kinase/Tfp pilus assembly protein PilF
MPLEMHTLDDYVEAFESAHQAHGSADLRSFLPPSDDPLHRSVLCELIRIDLEFGWESNRPRSLEEYRRDFPGLFDDPESVQEIAFEEYRLRRRAGQAPSPQEYARRYGVNTDGWPAPTVESDQEQLSVRLEDVARTYQAFCLTPHAPSKVSAAPEEPASIRLDSWKPPPGTEGELIRLFRDLHLADDKLAGNFADGLCHFPQPGEDYLGFHLISELGRGAFGRVYLARQGTLAERPVALKVAPDIGPESQTLAQLQHTHIVPVYSIHRAGAHQAVCMPYCGTVTVADVVRDSRTRADRPRTGMDLLRVLPTKPRPAGAPAPEGPSEPVRAELEKLRYTDAVLWMGARLAAGLHHAHQRGILHRDVKPANILITDEGLPMLLDFNVSEDVKQRGASAAMVGGTLPYMAPEMLAAFEDDDGARGKRGNDSSPRPPGDGRSDVWSLGLVLFELLTGRFPYSSVRLPPGSTDECGLAPVLTQMLQERRSGPPCPRQLEPSLSPATAAIIRHCLEPDPSRRYPSAQALQEDLERQLTHLRLRHALEPSWRERGQKWLRRHPRLAVQLMVLGAAVILLTASLWMRNARGIARAKQALRERDAFLLDYREAEFLLAKRPDSMDQLRKGENIARGALARYRVLTDEHWQERPAIAALPPRERDEVRNQVAELLLLLTQMVIDTSKTQRGAEARLFNERAEKCFPEGEEPELVWKQRARLLDGELSAADQARRERRATRRTSDSIGEVTITARDLTAQERFSEALALLEPAVRKEPEHYKALFLLGNCYTGLGRHDRAVSCYSACIALLPDFHGPYFNRGSAYLELRDAKAAEADFSRVIELKPAFADAYFQRAVARNHMNDLRGAESDLTTALNKGFSSTRIYFFRWRIRKALKDDKGAESDFNEGMRREPTDEMSWIARGFARMHKEPDKALADYDKALALNPKSRIARMNKVEVLAVIQNKNREARQVLEEVLELSPDHARALAALAVVLARLNESKLARERIAAALQRDTSPDIRYQVGCAFALLSRGHPADADTAIMHLWEAVMAKAADTRSLHLDPDLKPLAENPKFMKLKRFAEVMWHRPAQ